MTKSETVQRADAAIKENLPGVYAGVSVQPFTEEEIAEMDDPATEAMHENAVTELLAKDLAIKLSVRELERIRLECASTRSYWFDRERFDNDSHVVVANLLIGLGCEAVVKAWEECG